MMEPELDLQPRLPVWPMNSCLAGAEDEDVLRTADIGRTDSFDAAWDQRSQNAYAR